MTRSRPARPRRRTPRRTRLQAGARPRLDEIHQLRDLVLDHLGAGRLLHGLLRCVEQRRADRDLDRLAGDRADHPHGRRQHVRAGLGLPDRGRSVLVGPQARWGRLVVVHRLVQRARADRDRRLGRLRPRVLPEPALRPLGLGSGLHQLRRRPAHHPGDLLGVRGDPRAARPDQHLLPPVARVVQQHLGLVARDRGADHHRDPDHRPRQPSERRLRLHRADQQLRLRRRGHRWRHVLVPRPARGLPADDVHDHRL